MSCTATTDFLTQESGRFAPLMKRRVFARSLWMNIVRRGEWMPEMGTVINQLIYERSAPTETEPSWTAIDTIPDGAEGGSCLPAATRINIASTTRQFNLARRVLEGPDVCNIDAMPSFQLQQQLANTYQVLGDYAAIEWDIRYRHEYFRLCQTKVSLSDCNTPATSTNSATTYPATCASLPLALNTVARLSFSLMRDGAGAESLLRYNGSPLLTVITDNETAGNITRQNAELRNDIRWSNESNMLVRNFGVSTSIESFVFLTDPYPRRFSCSGGVHTEIAAFSLTAATKGQKAIVNSSWVTAAETETFIFDQGVAQFLIPRPPTAPDPHFIFDPVDYTGTVQLKNIINRECNPDGNIIYHRMHMAAASMPDQPERGVAIVHLRCDPLGCVSACAT